MGFNVPVLTEGELADVFAVFQAADHGSQTPMSISLMADECLLRSMQESAIPSG